MAAKRSTIATIGEALVDMIELPNGQYQACPGGSVCNLTLGLARQGVGVGFAGGDGHDADAVALTAIGNLGGGQQGFLRFG